jgi:hypothetical protein
VVHFGGGDVKASFYSISPWDFGLAAGAFAPAFVFARCDAHARFPFHFKHINVPPRIVRRRRDVVDVIDVVLQPHPLKTHTTAMDG